jgi:hypothetical protein
VLTGLGWLRQEHAEAWRRAVSPTLSGPLRRALEAQQCIAYPAPGPALPAPGSGLGVAARRARAVPAGRHDWFNRTHSSR